MDKYNISKKESITLYKLMKTIHDIFSKHKVKYWITAGSLLGSVRHGGLIPWDDDGDICMMIDQVPKLKKLIPIFDRHGYELNQSTDNDGIKCSDDCDWYVNKKPDSLGCDIMIMTPDNRKSSLKNNKITKITYANMYWKNASNGGQKCSFDINHVYPLVPIRFGNFFMYGPSNPIEHLNRCYGDNWNSHGMMLYNHRLGKWMKGTLHPMKTHQFHPIPPPKSTAMTKIPPIINTKIPKKLLKITRSRKSRKTRKTRKSRKTRKTRKTRKSRKTRKTTRRRVKPKRKSRVTKR